MHIEKVNYQKTFNLGNYSSEKIGVELSIHQGESATKALDIARDLVEEYHKENVERLKLLQKEEEPIIWATKHPEKTAHEKMKNLIDTCNNFSELKSYNLIIPDNLKEYYNEKLNSFKKNISK